VELVVVDDGATYRAGLRLGVKRQVGGSERHVRCARL
jgi:hypothetical protein